MLAVEVSVRLGETVLDVVRLPHGRTYRIGTAPDVDLPLAGMGYTSFPLVQSTPAGFVVRAHSGSVALRAHDRPVEIAFGPVTVTVTPHVGAPLSLPARAMELRPFAYGIAVLAAHLVVWAAANVIAPVKTAAATTARLPEKRRVHVMREIPQPPPPVPPPVEKPVVEQERKQSAARPSRRSRVATESVGFAAMDLSAIVGTMDLAEAMEDTKVHDTVLDDEKGFGGKTHGPCEIVECHIAMKPRVGVCPDDSCKVVGALGRGVIEQAIAAKREALTSCYQGSSSAYGIVNVELSIAANGAVSVKNASGTADLSPCVRDVVRDLSFAAAPGSTTASIKIAFGPKADLLYRRSAHGEKVETIPMRPRS